MPDKHPLDQLTTLSTETMGTLAALTAQLSVKATLTQNYKAVSFHGVISIDGLTLGDGPILWGFAAAEISAAELEEYLEAIPVSSRDTPAKDQVQRAVQVMGAVGLNQEVVYMQGHRMLLPTFREGVGFAIWVYNAGVQMTTGAVWRERGRFFGRWLN